MFGRRWKKIEVRGLLLNVLPYDVQYVFKRLSRYSETLFKFAIIPIIITSHPSRFLSYFTFSSPFPFLYLTQDSCSWYNNTNELFYIILIHIPFFRHISSISSKSSSRFFLHFLKKFWKSSILRQLKKYLKINRDTASLFTNFWRKQIVSRIYT